MKQEFKILMCAVAWPAQNFGWVKMFDFRRETVLCFRYCLLSTKSLNIIHNFEGPRTPAPPGDTFKPAMSSPRPSRSFVRLSIGARCSKRKSILHTENLSLFW